MGDDFGQFVLEYMKAPPAVQDAARRVLREGITYTGTKLDEQYVTLREVAQIMRCHPTSLWRWKVPSHKIGGRKRYLASEVRQFLLRPKAMDKA